MKRIEQAPELARRAVAADPLIDPESHGIPLVYVAGGLNFVDEAVLAEEMLDRGLKRATELGDPLAEVNVRSVRAWCRIFRGRLAARRPGSRRDPRGGRARLAHDRRPVRDAADRPPTRARRPRRRARRAAACARRSAGRAGLVRRHGRDGRRRSSRGAEPLRGRRHRARAMAGRGQPRRAAVALERGARCRAAGRARAGAVARRHRGARRHAPQRVRVRSGSRCAPPASSTTIPLCSTSRSTVLERSPARLELARSLMFAGIAQRRAGRTPEARATLARARDLARECGAPPLAERAADRAERRRQPLGRAPAHRRGSVDRQRAADRRAGRRRPDDASDRGDPVPVAQDGRGPSHQRVPQARDHVTLGARLAARGTRWPRGREAVATPGQHTDLLSSGSSCASS